MRVALLLKYYLYFISLTVTEMLVNVLNLRGDEEDDMDLEDEEDKTGM